MKTTWQPWDTFNDLAPKLDIEGPPCRTCVNWYPHQLFDKKGNADGVQLCNVDTMFHDFSCFELTACSKEGV